MAEEARAAARHNWPEPLQLERRNLLTARRRWLRRTLQSCCSTIHFLIRALASLQKQGPSALLQEIKVLVVAHNIPSRQFPKWDVAVVTSPVTHSEDSMQSQSIEEVVTECLTLLVNVADYVLKSAEDDSKANSDSLCVLPPELLIPAATIGYLSKAEECASPVDFLRMYLSPVQPALDSAAALLHRCPAFPKELTDAPFPTVAPPPVRAHWHRPTQAAPTQRAAVANSQSSVRRPPVTAPPPGSPRSALLSAPFPVLPPLPSMPMLMPMPPPSHLRSFADTVALRHALVFHTSWSRVSRLRANHRLDDCSGNQSRTASLRPIPAAAQSMLGPPPIPALLRFAQSRLADTPAPPIPPNPGPAPFGPPTRPVITASESPNGCDRGWRGHRARLPSSSGAAAFGARETT
ncbi:wiskott-Aldrich syndrome protein homolog 1 isoform X2 [Gallus gallus]|uniref:wiskott-Aldrich syndrome protein homolog 1 isoform X2 n=1 Tax=Gallus gallus TaxID=9031 RepID=UPI001F02F0E7|nr:wiskott-Aldrich syndrome protein homolog 1 isoform X2 [Gallus gallus]XP_040539935.2 wiskott-Aldrich syndrome protein homolog 1 isoform X2 [Gallus gallus]